MSLQTIIQDTMRKILTSIVILTLGLATVTACGKQNPDDSDTDNEYVPLELTKAESGIAVKANEFGFNVYHSLYEGKPMIISPLSLSLALSMTACGADGETEKQMTSVLGFSDYSSEEVAGYYKKMVEALKGIDKKSTFEVANSIWVSKYLNVKEEFVSVVKDNFASEERTVDFTDPMVISQINKWCSDNTHGKIAEIVTSIPSETVLALVNALYFNGKWGGFKFDDKTNKEDFRTIDGAMTKVEMMNTSSGLSYASCDGWSMVNLPYGNGAFRMSVILPPAEMNFADAAKSLDADRFNKLSAIACSLPVNLKMPQFKYEYTIDELRGVLAAMGMEVAFDFRKADFGRMADVSLGEIFIGTVKHKTFIDVNTNGTEAAAVTYVGMVENSPGPVPVVPVKFIVDRPFFYIISESSTGSVLFIGQKTN